MDRRSQISVASLVNSEPFELLVKYLETVIAARLQELLVLNRNDVLDAVAELRGASCLLQDARALVTQYAKEYNLIDGDLRSPGEKLLNV